MNSLLKNLVKAEFGQMAYDITCMRQYKMQYLAIIDIYWPQLAKWSTNNSLNYTNNSNNPQVSEGDDEPHFLSNACAVMDPNDGYYFHPATSNDLLSAICELYGAISGELQ